MISQQLAEPSFLASFFTQKTASQDKSAVSFGCNSYHLHLQPSTSNLSSLCCLATNTLTKNVKVIACYEKDQRYSNTFCMHSLYFVNFSKYILPYYITCITMVVLMLNSLSFPTEILPRCKLYTSYNTRPCSHLPGIIWWLFLSGSKVWFGCTGHLMSITFCENIHKYVSTNWTISGPCCNVSNISWKNMKYAQKFRREFK